MFDYVLNTPLTLVENKVWVDTHEKQQKIKALLNAINVVNLEEWTKM